MTRPQGSPNIRSRAAIGKIQARFRVKTLHFLRGLYPRLRRFVLWGWRPAVLLLGFYLFLSGPILTFLRREKSDQEKQDPLRALVESTTRDLTSGVRTFVVNYKKHTFTRKGGGTDVRKIAGSTPPALHDIAKQAWKQGRILEKDILKEIQQLKKEAASAGHPNEWLWGRGHENSSLSTHSDHSESGCKHWMLVTGRQLRSNGGTVTLPCGMSLNSAFTLVALMPPSKTPPAVPGVKSRVKPERLEFAVEVLGTAVKGGEAPTVIYHLTVRPQGDYSGKRVLEQNTCYRGRWGDTLRCEGPPSGQREDTVDGHLRCERWADVAHSPAHRQLDSTSATARSKQDSVADQGLVQALEDSSAADGLHTMTNLGGLGEGGVGGGLSLHQEDAVALSDWPFPVKPGFQFVMSVRCGREGFHVSVDGEHATSFPYRSGNPLQEARAVKVTGTLAVHSIFFTSMPTDAPLQPGIEGDGKALRAPELKGERPAVALFIGILSSSNHFAERMAVRQSWLQHPLIRSGEVVARFFLALCTSFQINLEVYREAELYGDMVILPFMDHYELLVVKTAAICRFGVENVTTPYIMKVDDDNFVRLDAVIDEIEHAGFSSGLYMGNINEFHKPLRGGKWAVTEEEWPETNYPPYANGPGYIITNDIAGFITRMDDTGLLRLFKMEDVSMGMWVVQYGINNTIHYVHNWRFFHAGCIPDYITAHYQSPMQMMCLWKKLTKGQLTCC